MSNDAPSAPPKPRNRPALHKRQYIVDKPFQFRPMGTLLTIWFANSLFFSIVLYFFYEGHLNQFYDLVPRPGMLPLLTLPALFTVAIGFIAVFGIIVLGVIGLYMSNQIAGPLFRTKKCLERVAVGDWNFLLQFREGDFMTDFPPAFNGMLEGLRRIGDAEVPWCTTHDLGPQLSCTHGFEVPHEHFQTHSAEVCEEGLSREELA